MVRVLVLISLLLLPIPALAQIDDEARAAALKAREEAERRIEADMVEMTDLVEIMAKNLGEMHFLRTLCFGSGDQQWREYMSRMLQIEAPDDSARQRDLTQAFNAGYYQAEQRHARCDSTVSTDVAALAENGRAVANMLGDPYRELD